MGFFFTAILKSNTSLHKSKVLLDNIWGRWSVNPLKPCVGKIVCVCVYLASKRVHKFNQISINPWFHSSNQIKNHVSKKDCFHKFALTKLPSFSTSIDISLSSPSHTSTLCILKPENYLFHVLSSSNTFHIALVWQSPTQSQRKEVCQWGSCPERKLLGALTHGKS